MFTNVNEVHSCGGNRQGASDGSAKKKKRKKTKKKKVELAWSRVEKKWWHRWALRWTAQVPRGRGRHFRVGEQNVDNKLQVLSRLQLKKAWVRAGRTEGSHTTVASEAIYMWGGPFSKFMRCAPTVYNSPIGHCRSGSVVFLHNIKFTTGNVGLSINIGQLNCLLQCLATQ